MRRDPAKAILVLNAMLEFFDSGRRWTRGEFHNHGGHRCLIGALRHVRRQQRILAAGTEHYLRAAMIDAGRPLDQHTGLSPLATACVTLSDLMSYNDLADSYDEVRMLIVAARAHAELDAARNRPAYRELMQADGSATARYDSCAAEAP